MLAWASTTPLLWNFKSKTHQEKPQNQFTHHTQSHTVFMLGTMVWNKRCGCESPTHSSDVPGWASPAVRKASRSHIGTLHLNTSDLWNKLVSVSPMFNRTGRLCLIPSHRQINIITWTVSAVFFCIFNTTTYSMLLLARHIHYIQLLKYLRNVRKKISFVTRPLSCEHGLREISLCLHSLSVLSGVHDRAC